MCDFWWRWGESNSWPPACKAGALPAELHPQIFAYTASWFPRHTLSIAFVIIPCLNKNYSLFKLSQHFHLVRLISVLQNRYSLDFLRCRRVFAYARLRKNSKCAILVGLSGLEPPTSRLSGVRSNRLSYRPMLGCIVPRQTFVYLKQGFSLGSLSTPVLYPIPLDYLFSFY